jgi:2-polyprenyl-3-methyl-5-hydroxy-6-metoxy-1,4-benzoquinol methylase
MLDPYSGKPAERLFAASDNYRGSDGHVFLGEIPENLSDHYVGGYQQIPATEQALAAMAEGDAYRLDAIREIVPQGDFLEIGPWIGLVAYSAKRAGYRVSALEMSAECVALMRSAGIDAVQTDDPATALRASGRTYDVIGLWHSIEHVPEPWKVIEAAAAALNPGGVLIVAAPNPESAQFRVLGKRWIHLDAPRHLHLMTIGQYEAIGRDAGLETIAKTTDDKLGRDLDRHGWTFELQRYVRNIPILRGIFRLRPDLLLAKWHRTAGALDGAGFTLTMRRPAS